MSSIYRFIACFVFILYSFCSNGQIRNDVPKSEIDSLINIIPNFRGIELVDHLNFIATSISQRYPDSCLYYANQALELSDSLNFTSGEAEAIFNVGNGYFYMFDLNNALMNYLSSLRIFEKLGDSDSHGNLLLQIGFINAFVGNHEKSINYYRKAQSIFNNMGNKYAELFAIGSIGAAFLHQLKKYDSAFIYYNELLYEYRQLGYKKEEAIMLIELGNVFTSQKDGHKAKAYFEKSLMISEISNTYLIGVSYGNLGYVYLHCLDKPNFLKAEAYLLDALENHKRTGRYEKLPGIYKECGNLYFQMQNYNAAIECLEKGLIAANDFYASLDTLVYEDPEMKFRYYTVVKLIVSMIYDAYYRMYEEMGDPLKAHYYYKLKAQAEDIIYLEATRRQIDVIFSNAENDAITQKIQLLEKEKELQETRAQRSMLLLIGSGILIVFVAIIAILYIRQNKLNPHCSLMR